MNFDELFQVYLRQHTVVTDSRRIVAGCIFFALKGEHFDGNDFVPQALEQGASACVTSDTRYGDSPQCMVVPDVVATLQQLASHYRNSLSLPIIGITGTNGKTTTKELIHAVLSRRFRTSATQGNLNNHLGVPLTLLAIAPSAEIAIVEMGANHPGEIAQLCTIASPNCGLITNVGRAHLEGFGGFEGVVHTKTELYRHLSSRGGVAFVCADSPRLILEAKQAAEHASASLSILTYGADAAANVRGTYVDSTPYMHFYFEVGDSVYNVRTHLLGAYNFQNCMAAVAVGLHFGVEPFDIKEAIEEYVPHNQRSEWRQTNNNHLYLDCYNANPSSMAAAISSFSSMESPHKAAIIGGMHELGADERTEHIHLIEQLEACQLEQCLLVGSEFDGIPLPHSMQHFADTTTLANHLQRHPLRGYTILVKGSNTNRLWTLEEWL